MNALIEFSLRQRLLTLILVIMLAGAGVFAWEAVRGLRPGREIPPEAQP